MLIAIKKLRFAFLLIFFPFLYGESVCWFKPPKNWVLADPSTLSPLVKVGFLAPNKAGKIGLRPSLNLAEEPIDCSLQEYLEIVKKIHTTSRHKEWSHLGTFTTPAGPAALTQIDQLSSSGPMRLLQLILIRDKVAYIMTAASLKNDFFVHLPVFHDVFRSLHISDDLYETIENADLKAKARYLYQNIEEAVSKTKSFSHELAEWTQFQDFIMKKCSDYGAYWQAMLIAQSFYQLQNLSE
jgi:hypothetical protein